MKETEAGMLVGVGRVSEFHSLGELREEYRSREFQIVYVAENYRRLGTEK